MLKLKKIAITGGVASGKTTVCRVFQELGAFVVNADEIVHELLTPATDLGQQVLRLLGPDILTHGTFNRRAIADQVFKHSGQLHALEKLLHPAVLRKIEELYQAVCHQHAYTAFVVEIPLLYEIGQEPFYDFIIAVVSPDESARERFRRAGFTDEEFDRRMKRQWPPQKKASRADRVIFNDGSLEHLQRQVIDLNNQLQPNS